MDNFMANLIAEQMIELREYTLGIIDHLGETSPAAIEGFCWDQLIEEGDLEDITNKIIGHYTVIFRDGLLEIVKDFVRQHAT